MITRRQLSLVSSTAAIPTAAVASLAAGGIVAIAGGSDKAFSAIVIAALDQADHRPDYDKAK